MNSDYLALSYGQVAAAAALIVINGIISIALRLKLERSLLVASLRTVFQLLLIGFVLDWVFSVRRWYIIVALMIVMTTIAGVTAVGRSKRSYPGIWVNTLVSVWSSSWIITMVALMGILQGLDWWLDPQYSIPLLGMILGNTLNGISLGLNQITEMLVSARDEVETKLALGATRWDAVRGPVQQSVRTGMIPIVNSMMVVGVVSLPGMMTGQLLSGAAPLQAVRYQIVIMFLIASATALGTVGVVLLSYQRLCNADHQFLYWLIEEREGE